MKFKVERGEEEEGRERILCIKEHRRLDQRCSAIQMPCKRGQ
jgi:hypothetical protein